jgi:hypothetical protein
MTVSISITIFLFIWMFISMFYHLSMIKRDKKINKKSLLNLLIPKYKFIFIGIIAWIIILVLS